LGRVYTLNKKRSWYDGQAVDENRISRTGHLSHKQIAYIRLRDNRQASQ
jgi:hypothetical protein